VTKRDELVSFLDQYLGTHEHSDYSDNGLQVEGAETVERVSYAVDASVATIDAAVAGGAQFLIVHHGLFWGKPLRIVGPHRRRVATLLNGGCSLYAVHLPLDRHREVGNNVQLAAVLGLVVTGWFAEAFGVPVGVLADAPEGTRLESLVDRLSAELRSSPRVLAHGPQLVHRVGIISGSGASSIAEAVSAGCDTFVTGETSHAAYHSASEYGINVVYAGHYASETSGLHALARRLTTEFGIAPAFVDCPTGL
jgi:dinuclear metal center YbgI/SA1388 family protein